MLNDASRVRRILIVGASGSGKTTLGRQLAHLAGAPLHPLDEIARIGGGIGPERPARERARALQQLLSDERWVAEGIHLGWTEPLFEQADVIVWLDQVSWPQASRRVVRRFLAQAVAEARAQKGLRKFTRFGDYVRQLRALAGSIREARAYQRSAPAGDDPNEVSRAATEAYLSGYAAKVVRCESAADVQALLERFTARAG